MKDAQTIRAYRSLWSGRSLWLGLLCACLGLASLAHADTTVSTIGFVPAATVDTPAPAHALEARAVAIDLVLATDASVGDSLRLQLAEAHFLTLQVTAESIYINGDYMLRAQGVDHNTLYSLALTVGDGQLFGHLSSAGGVLQIVATGSGLHYRGWQYRPQGLSSTAGALQHDFLIPDKAQPPRLPLQLTNVAGPVQPPVSPVSAAATTAGINSNNFRVTQTFDRTSVLVGSSVTATLRFENISNQTHTGLFVEVYFVLENSLLETASTGCQEQLSLSLQKVLSCPLGDFAPGEVKQLSYRIAVSEASRPLVVSTPVVGNLRIDDTINVVADVRTDSDGDGVSDYNENLTGTDPHNAASVAAGDTVIDVMAFFTPGARAAYPLGVETRINQLISVANQVYADSGVGIRLRPVYHGEVAYTDTTDMDTALDAIIYKTDPAFANVDKLRQMYGGDLVMLLRPLGAENSRCGLAPVGGYNTSGDFSAATEKQFGYAHIGIDCPADIVVAHELGHNMGLTHSYVEDGSGGTFDFSTGFGIDGQFATVMALPAAFNTATRVAQFSNPRLECLGFICGVDEGLPQPADAAQSLNIAKYQIANYFPTTVPEMPTNAVTTFSGKPTSAHIAIAASHDNGLSFDSVVTPADSVDVLAEITVDSTHVGANGSIYVLILDERGQVFQLTSDGAFASWDGTAANLSAVIENKTLHRLERLSLLQNFRFDPALVGQEFHVYIAYEVRGLNEFVYTTTPLIVRVQATK